MILKNIHTKPSNEQTSEGEPEKILKTNNGFTWTRRENLGKARTRDKIGHRCITETIEF